MSDVYSRRLVGWNVAATLTGLLGWCTYLLMKTPAGSVILWVTSAGTTLPRSMLEVSQSFFALLQKIVLNRRIWETR